MSDVYLYWTESAGDVGLQQDFIRDVYVGGRWGQRHVIAVSLFFSFSVLHVQSMNTHTQSWQELASGPGFTERSKTVASGAERPVMPSVFPSPLFLWITLSAFFAHFVHVLRRCFVTSSGGGCCQHAD